MSLTVAGILVEPNDPVRGRVVQTDGQVIAGAIEGNAVLMRMTADSTLQTGWRDIRQIGYRLPSRAPESSPAPDAFVLLRSGDRLIWTGIAQKVTLDTPYGQLEVPPQSIRNLAAADANTGAFRLEMSGGCRVTGTLSPEELTFKLKSLGELKVAAKEIVRLTRPNPSGGERGGITLAMRNGDRLVGKLLTEALTVRSAAGDVKAQLSTMRSMTFDAAGAGRVSAQIWDGTTLAGDLAEDSLAVSVGQAEVKLGVKAAQIASITNPEAGPPAEFMKKFRSHVEALGASSYKEREDAQKSLVDMGRAVLRLLEPYRKSEDPEVRNRVETIMERLKP